MIKGIHHICMKCHGTEELKNTVAFYTEILGLPVVRSWQGGIMLGCGDSLIELFDNAVEPPVQGIIAHVALATDDVDGVVGKVREAGYRITVEPKDIVIQAEKPFPARIAFCIGPLGEEIEFFCEK